MNVWDFPQGEMLLNVVASGVGGDPWENGNGLL